MSLAEGTKVNSKALLTKKYMAWRVLQAPGAWAQVYIDRNKALGPHPGAIIFPEQILGVRGAIYRVKFEKRVNQAGLSITTIAKPELHYFTSRMDSAQLHTVEDVYEFEQRNQDRGDLKMLKLDGGNMASASDFTEGLLFTNKRSAVRWASKYLERTLS